MKQNKVPKNEYIRKPSGKKNPYKDDVLYTPNGQWDYPGQVTRIPSGDITMQGVPYPVYGEDNLGYSQMMYPGMDYQFPGQYVTEYPMAAYGGDPSLPNIEGHYQDGGWLDQYQTRGEVKPIYVTNPNDPNLQSYQDSLNYYNKTKNILNPSYYKNPNSPVFGNSFLDKSKSNAFLKKNNIQPRNNINSVEDFPGEIKPTDYKTYSEGQYYPIYKKPVQPYIYKKQDDKTVVYTDKALFDKAYKAEIDSLNKYKEFQKDIKGWIPVTQSSTQAAKDYIKDHKNENLKKIYYHPADNTYKFEAISLLGLSPKKPVIHNVYQEPEVVIPKVVAPEIKIVEPKKYSKRSWEFTPDSKVLIYKDAGGKEIGRETYSYDNKLMSKKGDFKTGGWLDQYQTRGELNEYPFGGRFTKTHTHMDNGGSNVVKPLNLKKYQALPETSGMKYTKYPSLDTLKKEQAARLKNIRKPTAEEVKLYAKPDSNVIRPESAGYITKGSPEIIGKAIPHKIAAHNRAVAESSTPDILQERKEQPAGDKIIDVILNPFTAATNLYQHGYLPDYFTQGPKNINDIPAQIAFSYTNPGKVLSMAKASTKLVPDIAKIVKDPTAGRNYLNVADDILSMAHVASLTNKVPGFVKAINDFKKKELGLLPGGLSVNVGNIKKLYSNENKIEKGLDRPHPFQYGGWLDEYTDEYKRGGSLYTPPGLKKKVRQKGTSKNIVSSINKLFTRNYDLFGPSGKAIYNPKSKYQSGGGWLDNLE